MKTTINQVNGRIAQNQTINYYKQLSAEYWDRTGTNYRSLYFNFKRGDELINLSILGNWTFGAACKEFGRIIGDYSGHYNYNRDNRQINFEIDNLNFQVRISQDLNGTGLSCQTNFKGIERRYEDFQPLAHSHSHKVRSNHTFQDIDIQAYFEKFVLPAYLFAPGLFRNIQIIRNCGKKEAIQWYKTVIQGQYKREPEFIDVDTCIKRRIKRKLNILVSDQFSENYLLNLLKTRTRAKQTAKLFREPNIFELSDRYCSEFDTDGHEESFLDEVFNDYPKNAIFA